VSEVRRMFRMFYDVVERSEPWDIGAANHWIWTYFRRAISQMALKNLIALGTRPWMFLGDVRE